MVSKRRSGVVFPCINRMEEVKELESIPTKIEYKGIVWIPMVGENNCNRTWKKKNIKKNYLVKWIEQNKTPGDVFHLDQFFEKYPKHKSNSSSMDRMEKALSKLIKDNKLLQLEKDTFKVIKI